jgi:O-acetyl-ADP-ribose deacetylase (regulator of RNase III)
MKLHLVDVNPQVVIAWREAFRAFPEVQISEADILTIAHNTIVSPANSYGFMDGGIDAVYLAFFGVSIQSKVHDAIQRRPEGHLPIGASVVIKTGHSRIPFMILAPTMTVPEAVSADNAYRAMRAVLRLAGNDPVVGQQVFCPGMATLTGRVSPNESAMQMAEAYKDWKAAGAQK